jgi:hypothetical protein
LIDVELTYDGQTARVVWQDGGTVQVAGDGVAAMYVRDFITPGGGGAYNAARGGFYEGFDPADGVQVKDAVESLGRRPDWTLKVIAMEPPKTPVATLYPDDKDPEARLVMDGPELYARRFEAMPDGES